MTTPAAPIRPTLGAPALWPQTGILSPGLLAATRWLLDETRDESTNRRSLERTWGAAVVSELGIDLHAAGLDRFDAAQPHVVVPLHEGFADVPVLLSLNLSLRFTTRSELLSWPLLGNYLRLSDHLNVDPERPISSMRTLLRNAPDVFASGDSLTVFAQGTILGIETALQPGAFELAARYDRPVLPVVIAGTHRVWEHPFSATVRSGCPVYLEVLDPLDVTDPVADRIALQRRIKTRALEQSFAPVRRYDPDRDGAWSGYSFDIDSAFPDVADRVAWLRGADRGAVPA